MKRTFLLMMVLAFVLMGSGWVVAQQQGQDYGQNYNRDYGPRGQGWFCPWCGGRSGRGSGMGPGGMQGWGGQGFGRGPGMMHDGWGRGQYGPYGNQEPMQPLSKNTARDLAENYVAGNPNLKIGDVVEEDNTYIASIVTKDGSLVEKLIIDKRSGWMRRAY
jgi:hypothetical protein